MTKKLSVLGALGLLGQHLVARLLREPGLEIVSLHDHRHEESPVDLPWFAAPEARDFVLGQRILPPDAAAPGDLILSFLPDAGAEAIEKRHLGRGARILSHCEYTRGAGLLLAPGMPLPDTRGHQLLATPNCTTAICALPLARLHRAFGIDALHVTTLQAVSGTDLPGMQAHRAHDHVTSVLPGEARALEDELRILFRGAFTTSCMATRVPVWRGHTITLTARLAADATGEQIAAVLSDVPGIHLATAPDAMPLHRPEIVQEDAFCTVEGLRIGPDGWLQLTLRGDNLGMATTGLMVDLAGILP
ncbi:Asd/ArgC dimerization domain-containing protein [Paracoccus zeaxanthinifaciens]|uniref:Asd/ArgC dimerization domain-containing protein n=1 Tax=Paracoccus zeaxanthinifaciens TaxID=187400 RepID=UPI0003B79479|nr:Asd/ArgC dimerization domain-containing protein [Paracoccus zeaxanthinifaciens]